ncbi:UBX domain-containing protein, partial [Toxoplasma gondii RUB]
LREEQEREFAEVMRLESIKREELEKKRQKEQARRDRETQRREAAAVRRRERRVYAERLREQEMSASACSEQQTAICLRLPSGSRFSRQFPAQTSLEELYLWADCLAEFTENEEIDIPLNFHLVVPPRRTLPRGAATLLDSDLHPNSAVLLVPTDDEDE